jgi:hypothetical protein
MRLNQIADSAWLTVEAPCAAGHAQIAWFCIVSLLPAVLRRESRSSLAAGQDLGPHCVQTVRS